MYSLIISYTWRQTSKLESDPDCFLLNLFLATKSASSLLYGAVWAKIQNIAQPAFATSL